MVQIKLRQTVACPCCGHPNEDTSHILQCLHPDAQLLWDTAILQLQAHLQETETKPGMIEDLSAGIDVWHKQAPQPPTLTIAGQAQASLNWNNLVHGFLGKEWKIQQAIYNNHQCNMASATKWAADLLCLLLKYACQQWDHRNRVLHQLQPDHVKDLTLDTEVCQQYNQGWDSLAPTSTMLLQQPLLTILGLSHNEKLQWLLSIKASRQRQRTARARIAMAQ